MDWASSDFVQVVSFLLPGFVAAWVFHGLTPYPKPPQFERLVHALILTAIVNGLAAVIKGLSSGIAWNGELTDKDEDDKSESLALPNVETIAVPVSAVQMVEFMEPKLKEVLDG